MELSIIIPTYNRQNELKKCLESIFKQQLKPITNLEIIVIDDGGRDKTQDMIKKHYPNTRYIKQQNKGRAAALNKGVEEAKGEIVSFIDDDCVVSEGWATNIIDYHNRYRNVLVVQGAVLPEDKKNLFSINMQYTILSDEMSNNFKERTGLQARLVKNIRCTNLSIKRKLFNKGIAYEENIKWWQDRELSYQLNNAGIQVLYVPDIQVIHSHRRTLIAFAKQQFSWGRGCYCIKEKWKDSIKINKNLNTRLHFLSFVLKDSSKKYGKVKAVILLFITLLRRGSFSLGLIYEKLKRL